MELRFQRRDLLAFDVGILDGAAATGSQSSSGYGYRTNTSTGGPRGPRMNTTTTNLTSTSGSRAGGPSSSSVVRSVTLLDLSYNNIGSLTSMERLVRLQTLDVSHNRLQSLSTAPATVAGASASGGMVNGGGGGALPSSSLNASSIHPSSSLYGSIYGGGRGASSGGQASRLQPMQLPASITRLDISHNAIRSVAPLAALPNLAWLNVSFQHPVNGTSKLSATPADPNASMLNYSATSSPSSPFFDPSTLSFLPPHTIVHLDLSGLGITTTKPIAHLSRLERLILTRNNLETVDALAPLAAAPCVVDNATLKHLKLDKNPVASDVRLAATLKDVIIPCLESLNGVPIQQVGSAIRSARERQQEADERGRQQAVLLERQRQQAEEHALQQRLLEEAGVVQRRGGNGYSKGGIMARGKGSSIEEIASRVYADTSSGEDDGTHTNKRQGAPSSSYQDPYADDDEVNTSFTPEFGHSHEAGGPRRAMMERTQHGYGAYTTEDGTARSNSRRARSTTTAPNAPPFRVDLKAIKLQEMQRLLEELTVKEAGLKKRARGQQLSIAANRKVEAEQEHKLAMLTALEDELKADLSRLQQQLQDSQRAKEALNDTLLQQRIAYAV